LYGILVLIPNSNAESIGQFSSRVVSTRIDGSASTIDWNRELDDAGFYSITVNGVRISNWRPVHQWCCENFGADRYTWTGSKFWFETEQDSILFALKWGL